jgi:6,7-dimethyl-8-ribityllumazine synthase
MLTAVKKTRRRQTGGVYALVASRYNAKYVDAMLKAASVELRKAGVSRIQVVRVPGAFEIPVVAARLARSAWSGRLGRPANPGLAAVICLGVILRGETTHAAHIAEAVTMCLARLQVRYELPVIHEVLLLENKAQARARCLGRKNNRGAEAAQTALAMAKVMQNLSL